MTEKAEPFLTNVSLWKVDNTDVYDTMIKEIAKEIVNCIVKRKWDFHNVELYKLNTEYECIKFYLTMIILKKLSTLILKYYIRYYQARTYYILKEEIKQLYRTKNKDNEGILDLIIGEMDKKLRFLNPKVKIQRLEFTTPELENVKVYGIHVVDYLEVAAYIGNNEKEFEYLKLVNMTLHLGYVLFSNADYYYFVDMMKKMVELRIYELQKKLDPNILESDKLDLIVKQIKGYLVTNADFKFGLEDQVNEEFEKVHVDVKDFPPCINKCLNKIKDKVRLGVSENILLGSYLHQVSWTEEQIIEIYKKAINYDAGKTKYNVNYIQKKNMKPFNCDKAAEYKICYADDICRNSQIKNPLNYRRGDNK